MRVLFVVHQFMPEFSSGTEQVTLALAKAVQRAGHHASVLTCSLRPDAAWSGTTPEGFRRAGVQGIEVNGIPRAMLPEDLDGFVEVDELGLRVATPASVRLERAVGSFLDRNRYDLAHATHTMRMLEVVERVRAARIPYLLTLTDFFLMCYRINLVRQSGALCDGPDGGQACYAHCRRDGFNMLVMDRRQATVAAVLEGAAWRVACSPFVAEAFTREHPQLAVSVIGHGIDLLRMPPRRRPAGDDAGDVVFGYVGTLSPAKGVDLLARAFAAVPQARARLELVGPPFGDRLFVAELEALAAADPRIRLRGAVPAAEVPAALAEFDVLCLPTRLPETFSLALHEGFAAGLPALVADLGHPAGVVRGTGCGRVLRDGDEAAWSAAIAEIAASPAMLDEWRARLPLPARVEEETFLYSQLYKACLG